MPRSRIYTSLAVLFAVLLPGVCEGNYERNSNAQKKNVQTPAMKQSGSSPVRYDSIAAPMKNMPVHLVVARKALPAPACTLKRDLSLQSHFMMLHLCWSEQRFDQQKWEQKRKRRELREDTTIPLKKAIWPVMVLHRVTPPAAQRSRSTGVNSDFHRNACA